MQQKIRVNREESIISYKYAGTAGKWTVFLVEEFFSSTNYCESFRQQHRKLPFSLFLAHGWRGLELDPILMQLLAWLKPHGWGFSFRPTKGPLVPLPSINKVNHTENKNKNTKTSKQNTPNTFIVCKHRCKHNPFGNNNNKKYIRVLFALCSFTVSPVLFFFFFKYSNCTINPNRMWGGSGMRTDRSQCPCLHFPSLLFERSSHSLGWVF